MNSCQVLSGVSLVLFVVFLSLFTIYLFWRPTEKAKRTCKYAKPLFYGRGKCYSCEKQMERDMCNACLDDAGDNLERGVSVNLLPPYTNARLGYVTL